MSSRVLEEAGDSVELRPRTWNSQFPIESPTEFVSGVSVFEEITSIDETLRPVVVRNAEDRFLYTLQAKKGRMPSLRIVVGRFVLQKRQQVHRTFLCVHRGYPVCGNKAGVPLARCHAFRCE